MSWGDALGIIGGGLGGVVSALQYQDEQDYRTKALEQKKEIEAIRNAVRVMIENAREDARMARWNTPSANVVTQQAGATARNDADNAVATRGQDITRELGIIRDATTQRGQDLTFDAANLRD